MSPGRSIAGMKLQPLIRIGIVAILRDTTGSGDLMPRYLTLHTLACLTRQGAAQLTERLFSSGRVKARRVQVNMMEGKMLVEFEAPEREAVRAVRAHESLPANAA